jgi:formamidopyrimidine-DNA glycosylase
MIELPEAVVIAQQVNQALRGKRVVNVIANQSPHKFAWFTGDPADYAARLSGKSILGAHAHAGEIEISVEDLILLISAPLLYHAAGEKPPAKHQLLIEFEDADYLTATIQMWGGLFCFPMGEKGGYHGYDPASQRPTPLDPGFDRAFFDGLFDAETPKLSAKAFLATEQRIPGLGNGVLQDILWTARIHPRTKMASLGEAETQAMFAALKSVLSKMTAQGGRDTERDLFGCLGGYRTILSKNTTGQPCPACAAPIIKEPYMGGSIYYCPGCQKA